MIAVVHHPDYLLPPRPGTHQWGKNALVRDFLMARGDAVEWHVPEPVARRWIDAVHDPDYVDEVLAAAVPAHKQRRIGFAVTPAVARRSQVVPGGTWTAARLARERGYAANSAGGSHHALADTGAGYCVFNDLAIVANRLIAEGIAQRVLVIDCDVHQGDGTAAMLAGRPGIATYSIHAEKNFPARKARSTVDVGLPDGTGDDAYLAALRETLDPLATAFRPDFLLYQAGVDPYAGDRLGRLALSHAGLAMRERWIAGLARRLGVPIASALGGGYGDDPAEVARRYVASIVTLGEAMAG